MSSCRLNVRIPLTVEPAGQDISPASHAPLPWRCGELRADAGAKGISRRRRCRTEKTHCVSKMQPPPQSGVPLCAEHNHSAPHSFTGYQPLISGCRVNETASHSHDNSPSLAATVCRGHCSNSQSARRRWDLMPLCGKRAKASHLTPLSREAREGEESHDTPTREAREGEESLDSHLIESIHNTRVNYIYHRWV